MQRGWNSTLRANGHEPLHHHLDPPPLSWSSRKNRQPNPRLPVVLGDHWNLCQDAISECCHGILWASRQPPGPLQGKVSRVALQWGYMFMHLLLPTHPHTQESWTHLLLFTFMHPCEAASLMIEALRYIPGHMKPQLPATLSWCIGNSELFNCPSSRLILRKSPAAASFAFISAGHDLVKCKHYLKPCIAPKGTSETCGSDVQWLILHYKNPALYILHYNQFCLS